MTSISDELRTVYGVEFPFLKGTIEQARHAAQQSAQYLVIYMHCPTHENTHAFVTSVFGSDEVVARFSDRAVVFAASVMDAAGVKLAAEVGAITFPCIAVYFKRTLVMRFQGPYTREELLHEWAVCTDSWDGTVAEEVAFRAERRSREQARTAEEMAAREMELTDIAKLEALEREEKATLDRKAQKQREQQEVTARAAHEAGEAEKRRREQERQEMERVSVQRRALLRLPLEPPEDADPSKTCFISIRTLSGAQYQRFFYRSDLVDSLLDYAVSLETGVSAEESEFLQLMCGFPPAALQWKAGVTTFAQLPHLCPRAVVILRKKKN